MDELEELGRVAAESRSYGPASTSVPRRTTPSAAAPSALSPFKIALATTLGVLAALGIAIGVFIVARNASMASADQQAAAAAQAQLLRDASAQEAQMAKLTALNKVIGVDSLILPDYRLELTVHNRSKYPVTSLGIEVTGADGRIWPLVLPKVPAGGTITQVANIPDLTAPNAPSPKMRISDGTITSP